MARPPLEIGTYGAIRCRETSSGWVARTLFRDYDGKTRQVEKSGKSSADAERKLKRKIKEWISGDGDGITSESYLRDVAELWFQDVLTDVANGDMSPGTGETYRSILDRHVLPGVGGLRLREAGVSRLDRFLGALSSKVGVSTAKTARSVLSGVVGYATRHGALATNPVRDTRRLSAGKSAGPRALTLDERKRWLTQLEADEKAVRWDLPDISRFMMATGVRIGEVLALCWSEVELDSQAVEINYTAARIKGTGLIRKSTKTASGERTLPLPLWVVRMLKVRRDLAREEGRPEESPVFPNVDGGLRDPSNTLRVFRQSRGSEGFDWVTSHVFRKTAATVLDEAGLSARVIADQLGHAHPSMTQDVYLGRKMTDPSTASALEDVLGNESE